MHVLLAVDRSRQSMAAARFFQWLRLPAEAELTLLYVIDPPLQGQAAHLMQFPWYEQALVVERKRIKAKAQEFVDRLQKPLHVGERTARSVFRVGTPGSEIVKAIKQYRIDLAVLGSRGLSGVRRFLLGSASEWVLNASPCSVLIVRGEHKSVSRENTPGIHILLATNGSSDAQAAVTFLHALGLPPSSQVTALHVFEALEEGRPHPESSIGMMEGWADFVQSPEEIKQAQEQAGMAVLKEAQRQLKQSGLKVKGIFSRGHVADEIVNMAEQFHVDLIILGSRGMAEHKQSRLGSVSRNVARHAPCSALVVRTEMNSFKKGKSLRRGT